MNKYSSLLIVATLCAVCELRAADPTIAVTATPHYPWNGLVDLSFTVMGEAGAKYDTSFVAKDVVGGTNLSMRTLMDANGVALSLTNSLAPSSYKWIWNAAADLPNNFVCDRMKVVGEVVSDADKRRYMVVDLSGGTSATTYPVSYLTTEPTNGWSDEYKTTRLVLRRIEPGSYKMQGSVSVTLTKPFYIGVFEVTQKQYQLVMGSNPSEYKGDAHPVEGVSYDDVRGSDLGTKWPSSDSVDGTSFAGRLRNRTGGLMFDLPTEAQWEYACRAGTTSKFNNGGSTDADMVLVARCASNRGSEAHAVVGVYLPNNWGLYDMHGNVREWCINWSLGSVSGGVDPRGLSAEDAGYWHVVRGGHWWCPTFGAETECTSAYRELKKADGITDWLGNGNVFYGVQGFRVALTLSE